MEQMNIEDHGGLVSLLSNQNYVSAKVILSRNNMHEINMSDMDLNHIKFVVIAGISDRLILIGDELEFTEVFDDIWLQTQTGKRK